MKRVLMVITLVALLLGPSFVVTAQEPVTLPEPTGPYAVGRMTLYFADETRPETLTDDPDDVRELMLYVWYPADPDPAAAAATWLDPDLAAGVAAMFGLDAAVLDQIKVHALQDVPVAAEQPSYPVLIMSHGGRNSHPIFYTAYAEELASQGYVVVGITHTYNALVTVLPDERVLTMLPDADPLVSELPADAPVYDQLSEAWERARRILEVTTADALAVLDYLTELNTSDPLFAGRLDLEKIGMFGHSFGGATTVEAMARDTRIKAGVNLDGSLWSYYPDGVPGALLFVNEEGSDVSQPIPMPAEDEIDVAGLTPEQAEELLAEFNAAYSAYTHTATAYSVTITGAAHLNFGDSGLLAAVFPDMADDLGPIDPAQALRITNDYLLAFFGATLRGEASDLLTATPYSDVRLDFHTP
ncbi:MAG TPA: hypothetical protein VHP83_01225 [Aggregatilineaceae bacterium]|nr:hypothetical protein [Aggregatilineaceae bacterium]